jgi:hypothetical protein
VRGSRWPIESLPHFAYFPVQAKADAVEPLDCGFEVELSARDLELFRHPSRPSGVTVVTHVLGTWCYLCVRAGQGTRGGGRAIHPITPLDLGLFTVRRAAG